MSGWVIGYIVGVAVVVVVVAVLVVMIALARRVVRHADDILESLLEARETTSGLWKVRETNTALRRIVSAAAEGRRAIEGR